MRRRGGWLPYVLTLAMGCAGGNTVVLGDVERHPCSMTSVAVCFSITARNAGSRSGDGRCRVNVLNASRFRVLRSSDWVPVPDLDPGETVGVEGSLPRGPAPGEVLDVHCQPGPPS